MSDKKLSNAEIAKGFKKFMNLEFKPLGMYFSDKLPQGKVRTQGLIFGRCIVGHVFKASKKGGSSIIKNGGGCPGGQFWAGVRKKMPRGWAYFITHGSDDVLGGRAEHFKKDTKVAMEVVKDPGPAKLPVGLEYIIFRRLEKIPDKQKIEFILFFVDPNNMSKLISLLNYGRHIPYSIKAASGSGCMSIINFPLKMKQKPEADGVMGIWDPFARKSIPRNILSLSLRRWLVEEMVINMPESFLAHIPPFTLKGEVLRFFRKKIFRK